MHDMKTVATWICKWYLVSLSILSSLWRHQDTLPLGLDAAASHFPPALHVTLPKGVPTQNRSKAELQMVCVNIRDYQNGHFPLAAVSYYVPEERSGTKSSMMFAIWYKGRRWEHNCPRTKQTIGPACPGAKSSAEGEKENVAMTGPKAVPDEL